MKILGLDPGNTTGYAVVEYDEADSAQAVVHFGTWHGMGELNERLQCGLFDDIDVMAIERYVVYPNRAQSHVGDHLYTAQEIGRLKWIAFGNEILVVEQSASMAKQRWPNSRLKNKFNIQATRNTRHSIDALRHALTYIERHAEGKV